MIQKVVPPISFLFFRTETTVAQLANYLPIGQQLFAEAVKNKLFITGPIHWHYIGFTGDESKPFTLEICLPVSEALSEYDGPFHFKRTEPFACITTVHEGAWNDIPMTYGKLMNYMKEHNIQPGSMNREVYTNVDFTNPTANVTVIQMGIQ